MPPFDAAKHKLYYNALKVERGIDFSIEEERKKYISGMHGDGAQVDRLKRAIELQDGQGVFLFTGQRGSGKSTELLRLKYRLERNAAEPCKVYYLDMAEWLSTSRELELGSFMLAVVAAWVEQAGVQPSGATWAERFWTFLNTTNVKLEGIKVEANIGPAQAGIGLALQTDDNFLTQLNEQVRINRNAFVRGLHQFVQTFSRELCGRGEKCVLLIDSLEKLTGVADKAEQVYESVLQLFAQQSEALKLPLVHVVYSIAPYVLNQNRNLPAALGGAVAVQLPSVHVFKEKTCEPDTAENGGIDQMVRLFNERCPDWRDFFDEGDVRALAQESGGDLRDFLRALQVCLTGLDAAHPRVNAADVAQARSQIKPSMTVDLEHLRWMARVDASHGSELQAPVTALVLERYLSTKHVLAYLNGDTWYGLHPLIRDEVLARVGAEPAKADGNAGSASA